MPKIAYRSEDLVRHATDALVAIDPQQRILSMNPSAEVLTGYSAAEAVGRPCSEILHGSLCEGTDCPFELAFHQEKPVTTFDVRLWNRSGQSIPVCINTSLLRNAAGEKIGVVESVRDIRHILSLIAERQEAADQAERVALQLEAVLETSTDAVIAVDLNCHITHFNGAAQELTGYRREEVMALHARSICKSEFCPLEVTLEQGAGLAGSEFNFRARDGVAVPVWLKTDLLRDRQHRVIGAVAILRDQREVRQLREQFRDARSFDQLVGKSGGMRAVYRLLERVAPTESTVLITGESGTGKELVADIVHARSSRWDKPFIKVNCAALPENLLETELFGHVRGAFTGAVSDRQGRFQLAHTGTIFLDEIGDLPLPLQVKLLRVLQERTFEPVGSTRTVSVDLRIVAATNRDLPALVAAGRFREDLFYRLNVVPVELPPLREHPEDIPLLAESILQRLAPRTMPRPPAPAGAGPNGSGSGAAPSGSNLIRPKQLTPKALRALMDYAWPGNVRELENALEYALVASLDDWIRCRDLPARFAAQPASSRLDAISASVSQLEKEALIEAVKATPNTEAAARRLGISRATLWRKMKRFGVSSVKQASHA
ncbi:MAG: sigma 54-interacting transcriptional regulator [Bryobacterales bacterium]|nr:sigma 54-interacting transcriptional regulator [Bryobacterales bacterium]